MTIHLRGGKNNIQNCGLACFMSVNSANNEYCLVSLTKQHFGQLGLQHTSFLVGRTQTGLNKTLYTWTNFSLQDEPWAEFSTLEVAAWIPCTYCLL